MTKFQDDKPKRKPGRPRKAVQSETVTPGPETWKGHLALVPSVPNMATPARPKRSAPHPDTGLTDKQEAFCQAVTQGMSLSDAYRSAYNTTNMLPASVHRMACASFADLKIAARIKAIVDEMAEKRRMLASSDADLALTVLRRMAEKADTDASKIRAAELLAKAAGVFVEQIETTDKTDRTEADIERAIAARLARLGLAGKAG